jgi:hypothetical protein
LKKISPRAEKCIDRQKDFIILESPARAGPQHLAIASKEKILNEGALVQEMEATDIRTVYDFPVAGHLCSDGVVHYVKLTRRSGSPKPQGICAQCQTTFQYEKPQRSRVRHYGSEGASHF